MSNHILTIFTPTYNRAHTLGRVFQSLCRQTCKEFEWLIIDDGSTDNTRELVQSWIDEQPEFCIRYIYQANQGMHGAHNTAYANISTALNTCIDSDDYMPDDAVEKIIRFWNEKGSDDYAGIIGLDIVDSGNVIGEKFTKSGEAIHFYKSPIRGDKKFVIRTDLTSKYPPYPIFKGERYVGLGYKYQLIDQDYTWLTLNEPLVVVDYQEDGSSYNMFRQWWTNPRGFAFIHNNDLKYVKSLKRRIVVATHYVSHCIRSKSFTDIYRSNAPILTTLCFMPGLLLYVYTWVNVELGVKLQQKH